MPTDGVARQYNNRGSRTFAETETKYHFTQNLLAFPAQPDDPSFPYTDVHESDTQAISIPFEVECAYCDGISDLTTPGLALGVGQRVNINAQAADLTLEFDLSNGQYINLSEVVHIFTVHTPKSYARTKKQVMRQNPCIRLTKGRV